MTTIQNTRKMYKFLRNARAQSAVTRSRAQSAVTQEIKTSWLAHAQWNSLP